MRGIYVDDLKNKAETFVGEMPYKISPYSGRNWGHTWHSLCSYHGKLKPAIAHFLISYFTKPGDIVLDPMCGVGTIPFEASLQGRIGVGNDLSEMAYCVSKAKLEKPDRQDVEAEIERLDIYIREFVKKHNYDTMPYRNFGLNHKLEEYFEKNTYCEIIAARTWFIEEFSNLTPAKAMVFSALMHVLHGNRPYALSRISHPLTPYAPHGDYVYKNVIEHIRAKIDLVYSCDEFKNYIPGQSIFGSFEALNDIGADAIITSPPFADSIRFYSQNWMRLWLCGWEPEDFRIAGQRFLDQKQMANFDVYYSFFDMCFRNLKSDGIVILHLGKTKKVDMARELWQRAMDRFDLIYVGNECVTEIEKHGITDKGGTVEHQFLFLKKKNQPSPYYR